MEVEAHRQVAEAERCAVEAAGAVHASEERVAAREVDLLAAANRLERAEAKRAAEAAAAAAAREADKSAAAAAREADKASVAAAREADRASAALEAAGLREQLGTAKEQVAFLQAHVTSLKKARRPPAASLHATTCVLRRPPLPPPSALLPPPPPNPNPPNLQNPAKP